ncbi:MAG: hypothetical protein COU85_02280 [Candidatus Portnoybacteria bacterium CG10_big_fil_rev_8_21_14_0_10_44_7]|uniref:Photosynthesis system II assembly factor Ycf48/Hcf136-like domain-containing protein n=1 Tax=Candidatus Portnoybacteria bacterium CG10_big_fil_rev_8_21_14_0_10_44_7 TaxID=1974816 RepID=A0A2M8KIF2_9BACT|nr:MAG: hypothetical protein COU85_02280 [Candidatus Portnoybacteria bacterium CG10_big_fil_rev_8_21_14_0_10_44_7]
MKKFFTFFVFLPIFFIPLLISPLSCSLADDAGIFASFDGGQTWQQKGQISKKDSLNDKNILSLRFDSKNPRIIYAGTDGVGLYKTLDAGDLWYQVIDAQNPLLAKIAVYDIAVDPQEPARLYLAALGDGYGLCFRSEDGGVSWEQVYKTSQTKKAALVLEIDAQNHRVVYLGTAEGGILVSRDYGKSWEALAWLKAPVSDLAVDPFNSATIYAATTGSGIFKSVDFGRTWTEQKSDVSNIHTLEIFSNTPGTVLAASSDGLLKTIDGGSTWGIINIVIPPNSLPILDVAVNQRKNSEFYYTAGSVVYKTTDSGINWQVYPLQTTKDVRAIAINPHFADNILTGIHK